MGTRRGTPEHYVAAAKRANERERRKAPLLAHAGMVPVHTPEEQKQRAERIAAAAESNERERIERNKAQTLAAARELAKVVSGDQFRRLTAYARHGFPSDLVSSVLRRLRLEIEAGRIPWALTDDRWMQPQEYCTERLYPNGQTVPVRMRRYVDGRVEEIGPIRDPYAPKPTPEELAATKASMDQWERDWKAQIPAMRAKVEAWRRGEKVFSWQKCSRVVEEQPR